MLFNGNGPLTIQVSSGTTTPLFSTTDTIANGSISRVIAPLDSGAVARRSISFQCVGIGATIFGSNTPPTTSAPQNGIAIGAALTAGQSITDNLGYAYYWAVASGAGPGSVIAHVS
jgi:hypothetical protein